MLIPGVPGTLKNSEFGNFKFRSANRLCRFSVWTEQLMIYIFTSATQNKHGAEDDVLRN